jgi:FixJ family two-component response regulator
MTREDGPVVFVVDDDAGVRDAIASLLKSVGLRIEASASVAEFLARPRGEGPSCLVLDVRLPGMSGLEFQRQLADSDQPIPIIFITGHGDVPMSVEAMKAGAVEFLTKPVRGHDLLTAVQRAIERDRVSRQSRKALDELRVRLSTLTPREHDVMALVIAGLINKAIASRLGASERTIKIHRAQVMRKMQAASLPALVRMAEKLGMSHVE